nr:anthranilate synthase component I family protein [Catelliglobosispora koreensis]
MPESCRAHAVEVARFEWHQGDPGDPAVLLEEFLHRNAALSGHPVCGAAVLISAAAGAAMIGGATGAPSPAPTVPDVAAVVYRAGTPEPIATLGNWELGPWRASWTPAGHARAVGRVREAIARGDVYQVNVVGHASAEYAGDPRRALQRVAAIQGARYAGLMSGAGWAVACASPETLLEQRGRRIVTRPIKGTAPATPEGREVLLASAKERAEHVMIVDLERNDLAHVAVTGSVKVTELFAVRRWAGLWQAESEVEAQVRPGTSLAELLRAVCPGGSVTGAPKLAALSEIERLEPVGRGPAMGALGWIAADYLDLGLTIRTVAVDEHRVHVWAGGGITIDSDPWAEVAEADAKLGPVKAALAT